MDSPPIWVRCMSISPVLMASCVSASACITLDLPALFAPYISVIGFSGTRWVAANALKLAMLKAVSAITAITPAGASSSALADNLIHFNTPADV